MVPFSMKNLVGHLGVHDKTCHTMGKSGHSLLSEIIGIPVMVTHFCDNAPTIWD